MFQSIIDDIKKAFRSGNMVTRLIIVNIAVFVVTALLGAFFPTAYRETILPWIAIPGDFMTFITRPWTLITHMFVHDGFFHVIFNMLIFYWFGQIVGSMIDRDDKHILPIYILGGIAGAIAYMIAHTLAPNIVGGHAIGASAAVMAVMLVAGLINPDRELRLLIIGLVKIKYIILVFIFIDLLRIGQQDNTGGHIAHLAGMIFGAFYMKQISKRNNIGEKFNSLIDKIKNLFSSTPKRKSSSQLRVEHKSEKLRKSHEISRTKERDLQKQVDTILDKIKLKGYASLTDEEKETLYQASKKEH